MAVGTAGLSAPLGYLPWALASGLVGLAAAGFGAVAVFLAEGAKSSVIMTLVTMRLETVGLVAIAAL